MIGRQAGKIRLEIGFQNQNNNRNGYGFEHIQREKRLKQLRKNGYLNARDFVEDVSANFDSIFKRIGSSLILCKQNKKNRNIEFIELKPRKTGDDKEFYSVISALIAREGY